MTFAYETYLLGLILRTSMSEKKSSIKNENICTLCDESTGDFLEPNGLGDSSFILCANCEAMSTTEDLYVGLKYE